MIRKIVALLLVTSSIFGITACNKEDNLKVGSEDVKIEQKEGLEITEDTSGESNEDKTTIHKFERQQDFYIEYAGVKLEIPAHAELLKGWITKADYEELKPIQQMSDIRYDKEGYSPVTATIINDTEENKRASECKIVSLSVQTMQGMDNLDISLPRGIKIGSSYEDIIGAYGETEETLPADTEYAGKTLSYTVSENKYLKLYLVDDVVKSFTICYNPFKVYKA